jgi:GNAT superfamily N-acetyltransferase
MHYTIRKAIVEDINTIIELCIEHAAYEQANYNPSGKAEKLAAMLFCSNPELYCIVAECESKVIGYTTFSKECSTWNAAYYTYMDCLFLKGAYRGFGIGEALVNKVIEHSKQNNTNHIEWQTPSFNKRAIKFYERIGATANEKFRFILTI